MADLVVPQLGESISEAIVARWLKQVGEAVAVDEPIAELGTGLKLPPWEEQRRSMIEQLLPKVVY